MYPINDNEWLGIKSEPIEEPPAVGNVSKSWQWRERGVEPPNHPPNKTVFENIAEDVLVRKPLQTRCCDLPGYPRSTFLMVFSPDGTKVASTHGNHNVYVSELASGKHVRILKGHPRTPWCIAFHSSHPQLIASGCLGGQVRVWDIASGGSEVWTVRNETVIASIAFHPREQLLVIATYNDLYFWDWSQPAPFTKVSTNNINEKVRYVAFDSLGYKLITGISLWACPGGANSNRMPTPSSGNGGGGNNGSGGLGGNGGAGGDGGGGRDDDDEGRSNRSTENPGEAQDMIVNSYQTLVQRYDSLVRNYQRLFMVRHRLSNTPPPPNTIDRGTDPMETYQFDSGRRRRVMRIRPRISVNNDDSSPSPSTSRRQESADNGDSESPAGSRFLNLDVLSFDSDGSRRHDSPTRDRSPFGSRSSAFQPLNESARTYRSADQRERTRLLPNPFSSRSGYSSPQPGPPDPMSRRFLLERSESSTDLHSSRTSILFSPRSATTLFREFALRRRNMSATSPSASAPSTTNSEAVTSSSGGITSSAAPPAPAPSAAATPAPATPSRSTPTTTNSSTQMSPEADGVDAQSINESLDLIRDILRDSGTRLLNLITNISMNLLSGRRSRVRRLISDDLQRDILGSSSESDGDHADILRTPNSAFRDNDSASARDSPGRAAQAPTDRMVFDLGDEAHRGDREDRFRFRSQTREPAPDEQAPPAPDFDPNLPSTSRDPPRTSGRQNMSSLEAYRRVKLGVNALQQHNHKLGHMWLRGERLSMVQLRNMWENLRRRILSIQRELGSDRSPGYYTRSLLERCMILTDMDSHRFSSNARNNTDATTFTTNNSQETETSTPAPNTPDSTTTSNNALPRRRPRRYPSWYVNRWRSGSDTYDLRRRSRNLFVQSHSARHARRDASRNFEMSSTKHEIRMRAMQVLSAMFNMMMMCLEERGLSQVIMQMLRDLKKALALSCFMIMANRTEPRPASNPATTSQNVDSVDVVRIQNAEHTGPVNVDGPDDPASPRVPAPNDEQTNVPVRGKSTPTKSTKSRSPSTSQGTVEERDTQTNASPSPALDSSNQRWSRRLAVQIADANRNTSLTARSRRDLYMECKRQKALHKTNPGIHPLVKRRFPPVSTHRIPALRSLPRRIGSILTPPRIPSADEPVAGPSTQAADSTVPPRGEMSELNDRVNLIRIAHMQAMRFRNMARHRRYRRLQSIRLYTQSSVFALQSNNTENQQENESSPASNNAESGRRPFASYGPHVVGPSGAAPAEREPAFHAVVNSVAMPLVPPADLSPPADEPIIHGIQIQRPPRPPIHEYLQPIILAQNAMVVEEEEGGARRLGGAAGMAGLLDAGLIGEALPAPSNRVQAWDWTGRCPEIANRTKNVVVQRCKIHNDASIDISKDGKLLVALLPVTRLRNTNSWLGVYSLEWERLGQCLHTAMLEQSAVSVALSPTARYLAVGLGSRRFSSAPHARPTNVIALLYKLDPAEYSSRSGLSPIKELMQQWEHGFTSLNCLRWAPQPGQGLVYANNIGQLIIMG